MNPPVPPEPDPPEPGPDPPTPSTDYTFKITNTMSQTYYFRVYYCDDNGDPYAEYDSDYYATSDAAQMNNEVTVTLPDSELVSNGFLIRFSSGLSSFSATITWRVSGEAVSRLRAPTGMRTFTGTYAGNNASTIGVWSD